MSFNDDGCNFFFSQCGPALFFSNSILNNLLLGLGNYTLAVGGCCMNEASARSGVNSGNNYAGDYSARIASLESFGGGTGVASVEGQPTSAVPEPASMVLVATGLLGIGVVARRRRRTA